MSKAARRVEKAARSAATSLARRNRGIPDDSSVVDSSSVMELALSPRSGAPTTGAVEERTVTVLAAVMAVWRPGTEKPPGIPAGPVSSHPPVPVRKKKCPGRARGAPGMERSGRLGRVVASSTGLGSRRGRSQRGGNSRFLHGRNRIVVVAEVEPSRPLATLLALERTPPSCCRSATLRDAGRRPPVLVRGVQPASALPTCTRERERDPCRRVRVARSVSRQTGLRPQ